MHDESKLHLAHKDSKNLVFANCSKENAMYLLTIREIAESQSAGITMEQLRTKPGYSVQLVESTMILCKDGKLVIPRIQKIEQLLGIIITSNTSDQLVSKRLFAVQCIGKI
jgi:hypothetical protein